MRRMQRVLLLGPIRIAARAASALTLYGGLMLKWMRNQSMFLRYFFERLCFMALQVYGQILEQMNNALNN